METVTVSKKYQVVIPEKLRRQSGVKPGDKMVAVTKHGIIHYIPVRPIKETKGFIKGLNTQELRDESEELISIDSYGWIERFTDGPKATQYNKIIESCQPKEIITSIVVLFEVYKKIKKLKGEEEALLAEAALSQTTIVIVDQTIALEAADYSLREKSSFF